MSNFQGWLLRINGTSAQGGNYTVPAKYIEAQTYNAVWNIQDLTADNGTDGYLHRDVLDVAILTVNFTVPACDDSELEELMTSIINRYKVAKEKKLSITAWVPEYSRYITQDVLLAPSSKFQIDTIDTKKKTIEYMDSEISLQGYGGKL